ncbi:clavesin-2-like [Chironomus tepperi]|uniref:clavesin-2-like n=1 Tax=Chironomus tepperi TaxID=113505 RepID=UPI00391F26E8
MDISKLVEQNKVLIRENESRKRQALEQFRDWLKKHPFIKNCRQDDNFLLMFLRARKYAFDSTAKTFENNFLLRKKHPKWFDDNPTAIERYKSLTRAGVIYLLKDRNSMGEAVFCVNSSKFDIEKFNADDSFHATYMTIFVALEDEISQTIGLTYILNYSNTPMSFFSLHPVADVIDWVKSTSALPARFKKFIIIGLPPFTNALLNLVKMAMTEKQRDRLLILDTCDELCQHIDPSILPEVLGGTQSEEKIIDHFIKAIDDNLDKLKSANNFEIDEIKAAIQDEVKDTVGSFRKLDID